MKDEAKKQLKRILAVYDERLAETERVEAERRAAKEAFPVRFAALKKDTILPILEEFAEAYSPDKYWLTTAKATEQDESSSTAGVTSDRRSGCASFPSCSGRRRRIRRRASSRFRSRPNFLSERKVVVSSTNTLINSGGGVGKRGEYELETLTGDVVVGHVMQTLEEALVGK